VTAELTDLKRQHQKDLARLKSFERLPAGGGSKGSIEDVSLK